MRKRTGWWRQCYPCQAVTAVTRGCDTWHCGSEGNNGAGSCGGMRKRTGWWRQCYPCQAVTVVTRGCDTWHCGREGDDGAGSCGWMRKRTGWWRQCCPCQAVTVVTRGCDTWQCGSEGDGGAGSCVGSLFQASDIAKGCQGSWWFILPTRVENHECDVGIVHLWLNSSWGLWWKWPVQSFISTLDDIGGNNPVHLHSR